MIFCKIFNILSLGRKQLIFIYVCKLVKMSFNIKKDSFINSSFYVDKLVFYFNINNLFLVTKNFATTR